MVKSCLYNGHVYNKIDIKNKQVIRKEHNIMPIVGNRKPTTMGNGYQNDSIASYADSFNQVAKSILSEGVDLYSEPGRALQIGSTRKALESFFVENAVDEKEYIDTDPTHAASLVEDSKEMYKELFANDVEGVLEHTNLGVMNPVIGMTFPIHKNILMNNVFDKGAIPKFVAREPKFTITMENRILVTPEGEEIDMYKEQYRMREAIDSTAPFHDIELTLPQAEGATDILQTIGATDEDNLSIDTYISKVKVSGIQLVTGEIDPNTGNALTADTVVSYWMPVNLHFAPSYGEIDRAITEEVKVESHDTTDTSKMVVKSDVIVGFMRNNKISLASSTGMITDVVLSARLDTSSAMVKTCSVRWNTTTRVVEIGSANPINTTVSPEEVKDIGALYNVNQLSKVLSLMKTALSEYKDGSIKNELDKSFMTMDPNSKFATTFDFAPRQGYAFDHVEWRYKTFMDFLDSVATGLFQVLNDPNMTVSIFGSPELVRKITPTEYTYQTPSNIGAVELDFVKTVVTSDHRVYQFIATDKLRGNPNLIIVLCPRNTERIVYRIYDYQLYVSNEIRNMSNYALPAIHAFERWKFVEYQPVQGRIQILHPTGLTEISPNTDPIGETHMSDFNLIK